MHMILRFLVTCSAFLTKTATLSHNAIIFFWDWFYTNQSFITPAKIIKSCAREFARKIAFFQTAGERINHLPMDGSYFCRRHFSI